MHTMQGVKQNLLNVPSYLQVLPSTSVFSPLLFGACPPVPSCTGTLSSVSPPDEAVHITLRSLHQSFSSKKIQALTGHIVCQEKNVTDETWDKFSVRQTGRYRLIVNVCTSTSSFCVFDYV